MSRVFDLVAVRVFLLAGIAGLLPALAQSQSAGPLPAPALFSQMKWRSVGPYIGGRVIAVTGVPGNDNLFYAGTVGGGVWKSTDDGIKWENITDGKLPGVSASIGAIAVAPSDPSTIYAGTGEDDIRNDMIPGDGIYKSTDAGKTWQYAGLRETRTVSEILVSPSDPNVVYASTMGHVFVPGPERGVFKSTDGGKTWKKILFVDDRTGAIDLVMDPSHPDVLYAAMWQAQRMPWGLISGGPGSGLYKTTDGGEHWTNITQNPGLPTGVLGRIGITLTAAHPGTLYAIFQAKDGGVFRSDDAGATWKLVNNDMELRQRAFYYMEIYADPKDPNTVYVPQVAACWVSRDGGKTFTKLHTPHGDNHVVWIDPGDTKILLEGNDGGATVSTDGGKTWSDDHNQPTGQFYHVNLDDQFPFHIYGAQQDEGSFEGPSAAVGGSISLADWKTVAYGESTFSVPQPGDPDMTFGSGYYSIFVRYNLLTGQYESVSPWPFYRSGASSAELKDRFGWTHPILFSPANPKELLISSQYVFKSGDYGTTWTQISPDLTRNQASTEIPSGGPIDVDASGAEIYPEVSSLAVSPLDGNLLWAGSDDGLVHVTTDGGQTWQLVTPPGLPDCEISSIEPSHAERDTAYLTAWRYMWDDYRPYVYKTTDLGKHWTEIATGLPDGQFAFDIRQDPNDPKLLFLGAFSTVYVSLDGGAHWQPLKLNLPTAEVRDIAIDTRQGDVVIATHGRSFWVLDNLSLLEQLTKDPGVSAGGSFLFAPEKAWLSHVYGAEARPIPSTGTNPPFGATVFFHIPADYDGKTPATLKFLDAQGKPIASYALHLETEKEKAEKASIAQGKQAPDHSEESDVQQLQEAEAKLTAINPGMNSFQWDLRYPHAVEIAGYFKPLAAGGLENTVDGPLVVPGTYKVELDYGGHTTQQSFVVALDPRLHITQQDLLAQQALEMQIYDDLNTLDTDVNNAMAARGELQTAVADRTVSEAQAAGALDALNTEIAAAAQLDIHSSEGELLHQVRLRGYLAYIAADIAWGYSRPTAAQYAVFRDVHAQTAEAEQKLKSGIAEAEKLTASAAGPQ
ncbi:MAG: VPS10 domain-containing protein [Terracidiphilus sp.]